jgi:hypothetical protein
VLHGGCVNADLNCTRSWSGVNPSKWDRSGGAGRVRPAWRSAAAVVNGMRDGDFVPNLAGASRCARRYPATRSRSRISARSSSSRCITKKVRPPSEG